MLSQPKGLHIHTNWEREVGIYIQPVPQGWPMGMQVFPELSGSALWALIVWCVFIEIYTNVHFKLGITHPCIPFKIKHRKDVSKEVSIWATLHKSPLISLFSVFKRKKKSCWSVGMLEFLLVIYGVKSASLNKATTKWIRSTYKARSLWLKS